jgi:hypothetical protein
MLGGIFRSSVLFDIVVVVVVVVVTLCAVRLLVGFLLCYTGLSVDDLHS